MLVGSPWILVELPPRARRILAADQATRVADGTTSACAENTAEALNRAAVMGNYLRVRGEYWPRIRRHGWQMELPPRARRIPLKPSTVPPSWGTTSACAENTGRGSGDTGGRWNYLRVRGEYR